MPTNSAATLEPGGTSPAGRKFMDSWLQCDLCRKWRLVQPKCVHALSGKYFNQNTSTHDCVDWRDWLSGAEARHAAFLIRCGLVPRGRSGIDRKEDDATTASVNRVVRSSASRGGLRHAPQRSLFLEDELNNDGDCSGHEFDANASTDSVESVDEQMKPCGASSHDRLQVVGNGVSVVFCDAPPALPCVDHLRSDDVGESQSSSGGYLSEDEWRSALKGRVSKVDVSRTLASIGGRGGPLRPSDLAAARLAGDVGRTKPTGEVGEDSADTRRVRSEPFDGTESVKVYSECSMLSL